MNTLIYFRTWALTTSELITFVTDMERQIEDVGGADVLGIASLYPTLSELSLNLQKTFQSPAKNPVTADKEEAESYRDNRYSAFVAFVRNASYDSNAEMSAAAESIMDVINNVGNPTTIGDSKETAELYNLVARLSPLEHQINLIGANARLQELENANREFERLQNEWYKAGAKKISGNVTRIRQQLAPIYKSIIYRINALIEINGDAQYKAFVDAHNKMIEYYRNILAQRKGRRKAAKENATTENK
ncbi:MAG: DUF6261 family protein [Tannerella sp.]|jgi:hypothetical protein|nr:DUF6261 family protein [Tannerella sp.]